MSSDIRLPLDWTLGLALSYAVCIYGARYWAWPPPMQFERRAQLAPTLPFEIDVTFMIQPLLKAIVYPLIVPNKDYYFILMKLQNPHFQM